MPGPEALDDLARACPGFVPAGARRLRDLPTWEIAAHLIPMAPGHLRRVIAARPDLPQGRAAGGQHRFAVADLAALRAAFPLAARRGGGGAVPDRWMTVAVVSGVGGAGRTTLAGHLAMAAALDGWPVLAADLDPQAGLTAALGHAPAAETATALMLMAGHAARHLQEENRSRADRGDAPQPLDDRLARALGTAPGRLVQPTHWPGLWLVPGGPDLAWAETGLAAWRMAMRSWRPWEALRPGLGAAAAERGPGGLVILDTPAGLGQLALSGMVAADVILVPFPPDAAGQAATGAFLGLAGRVLSETAAAEDLRARALGGTGPDWRWAAVRAVAVGHDPRRDAAATAGLQAAFGAALLPERLPATPLAGFHADGWGIYEADPGRTGRQAHVRPREEMDALWQALRSILLAAAR